MKSKLLLVLVLTTTINCSRQTNKEAEAYFNTGQSKADLKDYRGAIADFSKAIELDTTYADAYYNRGNAMMLVSYTDSSKAIALNPKSAEAYFNRGNAKGYLEVVVDEPDFGEDQSTTYVIQLSRAEQAIEDFNKATELDPKLGERIAKTNLSYYQGAIEDYNKAIEIDPKYADAYQCRGFAKYELQDYRGAIEDYNEAINLDHTAAPRLSIGDYDKAIALDPKFAGAYYGRGFATYEVQDYRRALEDYDKAIELDPKYAAYSNRVSAIERLDDKEAGLRNFHERELEQYNSEIKDDPENGDAYNNRALVKSSLGDIRGAMEDENKAIELGAENNYNIGWSVEDFNNEIELDPKFAGAYFGRGFTKTLLDIADYHGAVEDFDKAIELDPKFAIAYYQRGLAKINSKQKDSGCIDLRKAGELGYKYATERIKEYCN